MSTPTIEQPLVIPRIDEWDQISTIDRSGGPYIVIVYNDDWHTFDQVIFQLCKATGCSQEKASDIAFEIDSKGRAVAYAGASDKCEQVATVLREIRLQVETDSAL